MAKHIVDEEMKFDIIINGNSAQKELFELEKSTRKLTEENKALGLQKKNLERQNKKDTEEYKQLTRTIRENNNVIRENKAKMAELQNQIGLNSLTIGQLTNKATQLRLALRNMIPGSANYQRTSAELARVSARISELNGRATAARFSISALADGFNRYSALAVSFFAVITGVVVSLQKMIDYNGKLAGAQSNVMKTTRMTKQEVDELTKSFGLFETRTSRMDLLKIAEQGGRIGILKEDIGEFVKTMNMANVALGDSFTGGPEEVAEKLGKIKMLFQETKNTGVEEAYMKIGSAINDLGADGVSSERNIAEFTTRMGSMNDVLKPSLQNILGLGAAFEESGIEAEVSSRAYGIILNRVSTNADKFAKVMGISTKQVEALFNKDPLEFIMKFAEGFKGVNMEATDTGKILDYLGINADGANKAIGAIANNTARFRELMELSNKSFEKGTSLVDEYNVKNNDLEATLEKIKKKVTGWFSSDGLVSFLSAAAVGFAKLIGATDDADGSGNKWRNTLGFIAKAIVVVTSALITSTAWMKLTALWTSRNTEATLLYNLGLRARAVAEGISIVASQAFAAAQMLLTGNVKGATQAIRVMTSTMMTTPWGLVLGLIAAVAASYAMFADKAKEATIEQKAFLAIQTKVNDGIDAERKKVSMLMQVAKDENASKAARLKAIKDLNEISPEYLGNLTLETINTDEAAAASDRYVKSLEKRLEAEEIENQIRESRNRKQEIEQKNVEDYMKWYDGIFSANSEKERNKLSADRRMAELKAEDDLQKKLYERRKKLFVDTNGAVGGGTTSTYTVPDESGDKAAEKAREARIKQREKDLEAVKKLQEEVNDLERKAIDERISFIQEGFDKEHAIEAENHRRKIEDLKRQLIAEHDIAQAEAKVNDPEATPLDKAMWSHMKESYLEKNKHINTLLELEEGRHKIALETIDLKAEEKKITDLQEQFDHEASARLAAHNIEMANLGDRALAKEALQAQFDKNELEYQEKHLRTLLEEKQKILSDSTAVDTSLLTPEQKKELQKDVDELMLKISELLKAKAALRGETESPIGLGLNSNLDILGFSRDQWLEFFNNLEKGKLGFSEMAFAVQALTDMYSKYASYMTANENAQLRNYEKSSDARKRKLKWQLDNGYINQSQYKKRLEQMDAELDVKKAELAYKQAKREKGIALASAASGTAMAVVGALGNKPWTPANFVLAGIVGAMGLLQIATIARQPLPARGYEEGLYPEYVQREQDGKIFKSRYGGRTRSGMVNKPTYFLAGENGPEMIIDSKAYRDLSPETRYALENELRRIKGFEKGYYNNNLQEPRYEVPAAPVSNSRQNEALLLSIIERNTAVMEKLLDEGVSYSPGSRGLKRMMDDMDKIKQSKEKARY